MWRIKDYTVVIRSSDMDLLGSLSEERLSPMLTFIDVAKGWCRVALNCEMGNPTKSTAELCP